MRGGTPEKYFKICNFGVDYVVFKAPEIKYGIICCKKLCLNEGVRGGTYKRYLRTSSFKVYYVVFKVSEIKYDKICCKSIV